MEQPPPLVDPVISSRSREREERYKQPLFVSDEAASNSAKAKRRNGFKCTVAVARDGYIFTRGDDGVPTVASGRERLIELLNAFLNEREAEFDALEQGAD